MKRYNYYYAKCQNHYVKIIAKCQNYHEMLKCCETSKLLYSQNYCKHYNYCETCEMSKLS